MVLSNLASSTEKPNCFSVRKSDVPQPQALVFWRGSDAFIIPRNGEASLGAIKEYVAYRTISPPSRIERVQKGTDVELRNIPLPLDDFTLAQVVAGKLTFTPLNKNNFLFAPYRADQVEIASAIHLTGDHISGDLFALSNKCSARAPQSPPNIRCLCLATHSVFSERCSKCGRWNPLGHLWKHSGEKIIAHMSALVSAALPSMDRSLPSADSIVRGSDKYFVAFDAFPVIEEDEEEKQSIRKLLQYFDGLFGVQVIDKTTLEAARELPKEFASTIIADLVTLSVLLRRCWNHTSFSGWLPGGDFTRRLYDGERALFESVVIKVKDVGGAVAIAASMYAPIQDHFKKMLNPSMLSKAYEFFRWFVAGFTAVATFGVSLLLKVGLSIFKEKKQQERYERFIAKLDELFNKSKALKDAVDLVRQRKGAVIVELTPQLINHMLILMAHDYAASPHDGRVTLACNLARSANVTDWSIPIWNPNYRRKRIIFWSVISVLGLVVAGLILWLIVCNHSPV